MPVSIVKRDLSAKIDKISSATEGVEKRVTENEKKISTNFDKLHCLVKDVMKLIFNEVNEIEARHSDFGHFWNPRTK